jgi:hypothetical protein
MIAGVRVKPYEFRVMLDKPQLVAAQTAHDSPPESAASDCRDTS